MSVLFNIKKFIQKKIDNEVDLDEFSVRLSSYIITFFASAPHIFFMFYFLYMDIKFLCIINFLSCLCYVIAFWLIKNKKFITFIIMVTTEVLITTTVTVLYVGSSSHMQWFLLITMMPHFLFFKTPKNFKTAIIGVLSLFLIFLSLSENFLQPIHSMDDNWIFKMINVGIVISGSLVEFEMDKFVKKLLKGYHERSIEELQEQAYFDSLTNLMNRRYANIYFDSIINNTIERRNICITIVDIDDFKMINDTYGHDVGDQVLVALADIFNKSVRSTDYIFRWGGEEFVIVTNDADLDAAYNIIDNIRKKVEQGEFNFGGYKIKFTITAGIVNLIGNDISTTIKKCDEKLYQGKNSGKNKVVI